MTNDALKPGDEVLWSSSGGRSLGRVLRTLTSPIDIKGHHVAASPSHPEYLVRSGKSRKLAAHRAQSLERRS